MTEDDFWYSLPNELFKPQQNIKNHVNFIIILKRKFILVALKSHIAFSNSPTPRKSEFF